MIHFQISYSKMHQGVFSGELWTQSLYCDALLDEGASEHAPTK